MIIRRYKEGEELQIWSVYFRATHESNARDYHVELLNRWAPKNMDMAEWASRLREKNPWVAVSGDQIVGFAELDSTGFIDYFYVVPDKQGQGFGKALMDKVISEALTMGVSAITADVSVTAKEFFAARGFRVVESRMNLLLGHPAPNFSMLCPLGKGADTQPKS